MFLGGLDLGQAGDWSALSILYLAQGGGPTVYQIQALTRFELGLSYLDIVDQVHALWHGYGLTGGDNILCIDYTGVGRPVVDLFLRRGEISLRPITITGGTLSHEPQPGWHNVPKKELASAVQLLLRGRRLQINPALSEAPSLLKELMNFKVKISTSGNELYEAWRSGDKDDLVLATAMPCWLGEKGHLGAFEVTKATTEMGGAGYVAGAPPGVWPADEPGDIYEPRRR